MLLTFKRIISAVAVETLSLWTCGLSMSAPGGPGCGLGCHGDGVGLDATKT